MRAMAVGPVSKRHESLSRAPCCNETEGGLGRDMHLIGGFECYSIPRPPGGEMVMIYGQGDLPFKHVSLSP